VKQAGNETWKKKGNYMAVVDYKQQQPGFQYKPGYPINAGGRKGLAPITMQQQQQALTIKKISHSKRPYVSPYSQKAIIHQK